MKSLYKIFHPEIFQGSLKNNNYFEGWYFKHVSADTGNAFAIIAGISLSDDSHSFIQYIDGNTGKTSYFRYSLSEFVLNRRKFEVRIGRSSFSEKAIRLDLSNDEFSIMERSGISILHHCRRISSIQALWAGTHLYRLWNAIMEWYPQGTVLKGR